MRKQVIAAIFAAAVILTGCHRDTQDDPVYHIYSEGTYIEADGVDIPAIPKSSEADFYIPEGMKTDSLSRSVLTDSELELYDSILNDIGFFKETVPLTVDALVYTKVAELVRIEQLAYIQVSDISNEYNLNEQRFDLTYNYRFTADEVSRMNLAAENAAEKIMEGITPGMDDYEKLKYFHDYIVLNCEPSTEDPYTDTIYGALVRGKALCEGYAKAFSYLCNLAGIENIIVTGGTNVPHMWNMVKLGGNWYHVDVTWDDADDKLHEDYPDIILYQYFMITDSVIRNNHTIWTFPAEPPKANGRNENYFVREGTDIGSEEEFFTASENAITAAVVERRSGAMVKFETSDLYISVTSRLENNVDDIFEPIISRIRSLYGINVRLSWTDYYGQYRILTYIIEYP